MNLSRSYRSIYTREAGVRTVATTVLLVVLIGAAEALFYYDLARYATATYTLLVLALVLAPVAIDCDIALVEAFLLLPVFRLVNLTMPTYFQSTLTRTVLIYAPFLLVFIYLSNRNTDLDDQGDDHVDGVARELPWWLGGARSGRLRRVVRRVRNTLARPSDLTDTRRILYRVRNALVVLAAPFVILGFFASLLLAVIYIAQVQAEVLSPEPLVDSLGVTDLVVLTVTMVAVIGFVEEVLFRGILQSVVERRLGLLPALLVSSLLFGVMTAGFDVPIALLAATGAGLLFGVVYDLTESLILVSVLHGIMNTFLFGVIPLSDGAAFDVLRASLAQYLGVVLYPDVWSLAILV